MEQKHWLKKSPSCSTGSPIRKNLIIGLTGLFLGGWIALRVSTASAQLNQGGTPLSFIQHSLQRTVHLELTPPNLEAVAAEDLLHPVPYRFAVNLPVNVSIPNVKYPVSHPGSRITDPGSQIPDHEAGYWTILPSGNRIWIFTIRAPGAKAITVYFDHFFIPPGGRLFLYNGERSEVIGAFTALNNSLQGTFATGLITGDIVTIEYNHPANLPTLPALHISEIAYAYRGVPEATRGTGFGSAGPCEVNIPCPEGDLWQDPQKSVARIGVKKLGNSYWCSGSLVNNVRQDKTPYLLTADHCGKGATPLDYSQWVFYFHYTSPTCENPPVEPAFRALTGAMKKAASGDVTIEGSDFLLLLLNQEIPDTFDVWLNGWNRTDIPSLQGVGIHHPMGDIKKISTYVTPLISTGWNGLPNLTHWRVKWAQTVSGHGVTEGGSSGSPIFDADKRVVGALTGGDATCDSAFLNQPDYYGKFSYSWDQNGPDSTKRLDYWLDPDNTGVLVLDGLPLTVPEPETVSANLVIFPNPVSGNVTAGGATLRYTSTATGPAILHLRSSLFISSDVFRIAILDAWGREVLSVTNQGDLSGLQTVDVSPLPEGFYLVTIRSKEHLLTGRFIKL